MRDTSTDQNLAAKPHKDFSQARNTMDTGIPQAWPANNVRTSLYGKKGRALQKTGRADALMRQDLVMALKIKPQSVKAVSITQTETGCKTNVVPD